MPEGVFMRCVGLVKIVVLRVSVRFKTLWNARHQGALGVGPPLLSDSLSLLLFLCFFEAFAVSYFHTLHTLSNCFRKPIQNFPNPSQNLSKTYPKPDICEFFLFPTYHCCYFESIYLLLILLFLLLLFFSL